MNLKAEICIKAKRDCLDQVHSDQVVLVMARLEAGKH
jgi:hypothetical protein